MLISLTGQTRTVMLIALISVATSVAVASLQVTMQHLAAVAVPSNRAGGVSSVLAFRFAGHASGPLVLVPLVDDNAGWAFGIAAALSAHVVVGFVGSTLARTE